MAPSTPGQYAGAATAFTGTWATTASATGRAQSTYATWTSASALATATLELSAFDLQSRVPSGATITGVRVRVRHATSSNTLISAATARLYTGTTARGPGTVTLTRTANTVTEDEFTVTSTLPTWAELADLRLRVVYSKSASSTSSTAYVDAVRIEVLYTFSGWATVPGEEALRYPDTTGLISASTANVNFTMGQQFSVTALAKYVKAIAFYRPDTLLSTLTDGALFERETGLEVPGTRVTFGDVTGESLGWVVRALPPVALTPGVQYIVACHFVDRTPSQATTPPDIDGPFIEAGAEANPIYVGGTALTFPTTVPSGPSIYLVDVLIGDLPLPGAFLPYF